MINKGLIIAFDGKNSQIPRGWERVTSMDGLYLRGAESDAQVGQITGEEYHSHSPSEHRHTLEHSHESPLVSDDKSVTYSNTGSGTDQHRAANHHHGFSHKGDTSGARGNTERVKNEPPYYKVIFIRALSNRAKIPKGGIVFRHTTTIPVKNKPLKKVLHEASAEKFLLGADKNGDAGETAVGALCHHVHADKHTHGTSLSHSHSDEGGGNWGGPYISIGNGDNGEESGPHGHYFTTDAATIYAELASPEEKIIYGTLSETFLPAYQSLYHFWANRKNTKIEQGDILMADEYSLATYGLEWYAKKGWLVCDGVNFDDKTGVVTPKLNINKNITNMGNLSSGGADEHNHEGGENLNHRHLVANPQDTMHKHTITACGPAITAPASYIGAASGRENEDGIGSCAGGSGHRHLGETSASTINDTGFATAASLPAQLVPLSKRVYFMYCTKKAARINQGGWIINRMIDG